MKQHQEALFATMDAIRQDNLAIYKQMAKLTDAAKLGWKAREPGQFDVTMALVKTVVETRPLEAARLLTLIADNDERLVALTRELAYDLI